METRDVVALCVEAGTRNYARAEPQYSLLDKGDVASPSNLSNKKSKYFQLHDIQLSAARPTPARFYVTFGTVASLLILELYIILIDLSNYHFTYIINK